MTEDRVDRRAEHLLPEELAVEPGVEPREQAAALLAESDERTAEARGPVATDPTIEHRTSEEAAR
jgi:hypothetical protein